MRAKKVPIHEEFNETIANMRKNATSFRPKKHQDENTSEAADFLCNRFQMSTKHLQPVTTIRNQYMFLQEVEKKDTNSPSRKQEKNAPINQVIFHQIANSRFFLINLRTITFARTNPFKKSGEKIHCLGIPTIQKFEKKFISSKFLHMAEIFIIQNH